MFCWNTKVGKERLEEKKVIECYNEDLVANERNKQGYNFQQHVFIKIWNIHIVV